MAGKVRLAEVGRWLSLYCDVESSKLSSRSYLVNIKQITKYRQGLSHISDMSTYVAFDFRLMREVA